ncbi:MAG: hypothetical protein IPM08_04750 [Actinomycetales bacterium]|nr:hypothetical protein [Actinomycetales bacterium]
MSTTAAAQLPGPVGDPDRLLTLARTLGGVGTEVAGTTLARSGSAAALPTSWVGPAAAAAQAELGALAGHVRVLGDGLAPMARIVLGYAGALSHARQTVAGLRTEWDAAARKHRERRTRVVDSGALDPAAGLAEAAAADRDWAQEKAHLMARHTRVMTELADAGRLAAAAIHVSTGPAFGDPGQARDRILATLPLTEDTAAGVAATVTVARWLQGHPGSAGSWTVAELASLGDLTLADRHIAQAFLAALGPVELRLLTGRLLDLTAAQTATAGPGRTSERQGAEAALLALATAYSSALSPAGRPDSAAEARAAAWRSAWSAAVKRADATPSRASEVLPLRDIHAQAALLRIGRAAGLSAPADDVLMALIPAVMRAETLDQVSAWHDDARTDAVAALLDRCRDRPESAMAILGTPLGSYAFLSYLVVDRPATVTRGPSAPVAYVADAMADILPCAPIALSSQVLAAVAQHVGVVQATPGPELSIAQSLAPWRALVAQLLLDHPDATQTVLLAPASSAGLDTPGWSEAGLPQLRLPNERAAARLWGLVGLPADSVLPWQPGHNDEFTAALSAACGEDLLAVIRTLPTNPDAADAALRRAGVLIGFTTTGAADVLAHVAQGQDAANSSVHERVDPVLEAVKIPARFKVGVPGALAALGLHLLTDAASSRLDQLAPTNAGQAAETAAREARIGLAESTRALAWDLVSRAGAWAPADDPRAWITLHRAPDFLDQTGHPRPWSSLTTAQRDAFVRWAQDVPSYTRLPSVLEQAIATGRSRAHDLVKS